MGAVAAGFLVLVATAGILAAMAGAIAGVIIWRFRIRPAVGIAAVAAAYLSFAVPNAGIGVPVIYGLPLLALVLLSAWLAADRLHHAAGLRPMLAVSIALVAAFLLGMIHVLMLRLHLYAPVLSALAGTFYCGRIVGAARLPRPGRHTR